MSWHRIVKQLAENEISFKQFISKFKPLRLPLSLNPDSLHVHDSLSAISGTDAPYLIIDKDKLGSNYAYGILPDIQHSYKLIWLYPAEIYISGLNNIL